MHDSFYRLVEGNRIKYKYMYLSIYIRKYDNYMYMYVHVFTYMYMYVHKLIIIFPCSGVIGLIWRPADFGTYFLFIMIVNLLSSLIYYIVTKVTT